MIIDQSIKDEVRKQAEQMARKTECPTCATIGMTVGEVYTQMNYVAKAFIPRGQEKPTKRDVDHPFDLPVELICPQCGDRWPEAVESPH